MIRRSPCEYYIKFLILQPRSKDDQIEKDLAALHLDSVGSNYLSRLRQQCLPPLPFFPKAPSHSISQQFIIQQGVRDLFIETPSVKTALRILRSPRAKEFVEAMTLSGAPAVAISIAIAQQCRVPCTGEAITTYQRYFWNVNLVDSTEMKAILFRRAELAAESTDEDSKKQAKAWKTASYTDSRRTAALLPHSPITAMLSQLRLGSLPKLEELAKLAQLTQFVATARACEVALYGGPDDSNRALNYAIVGEKMGTILEQIVKPDADLREQLNSIALRNNGINTVAVIDALSGGRHTADLMPGDVEGEPVPRPPE